MAMNFRNVNELEELSKLGGGDKLIVNSNGVAKQISASAVGGSSGGGGGGGIVYTDADLFTGETDIYTTAYADPEMTTKLTYDEAKKLFMGGAIISAPVPEEYKSYGIAALTGSAIAVGYADAVHTIAAYVHGFSMSLPLPQCTLNMSFES